MRTALLFTLVTCIIHFSPAMAQNSASKSQLFVGGQGSEPCCGGSGNSLYNSNTGNKTAGPLNIKGMIKNSTPGASGHKKIMRSKINTYDFGQGYSSDKRDRNLQELARQTEMNNYENALMYSEQRQAKLQVIRDKMAKNLEYYKQQAAAHQANSSANSSRPVDKAGTVQPKTPYVNRDKPAQNDKPKRLFLSDR